MFLSLPVKAQLGGKVLLFLRDASGLYMHSGGKGREGKGMDSRHILLLAKFANTCQP